MVQPEALVPGSAIRLLRLQAPDIVTQSLQRHQLRVVNRGMIHQLLRPRRRADDMVAVNGKGDHAARPPQGNQRQQGDARRSLPRYPCPHAPRLSAVRRHALPDRRSGPAVFMARGTILRGQRRAEHQAAQRNTLQVLRQPRRQQRFPVGYSLFLQLPAET